MHASGIFTDQQYSCNEKSPWGVVLKLPGAIVGSAAKVETVIYAAQSSDSRLGRLISYQAFNFVCA